MEQQVNLSKQMDTQSKALAAIGYLGWLVLIPILAVQKPNNFIKKHINCSLMIMLASMILGLLTIPICMMVFGGFLYMKPVVTLLGFILLIIYSIVIVGVSIIQWVCLIRAALGYEASLWKLKIHNFLTID